MDESSSAYTTGGWTPQAVRTPATSLTKAMMVDDATVSMHVQKISTRGKFKARVLTVPKDRLALFCTPQKLPANIVAKKLALPVISRAVRGVTGGTSDGQHSYMRYLDVADINSVQSGCVGTRKLESTRSNRLKGKDGKVDVKREQIVTICLGGDKTLDILVPNQQERKRLIAAIRQMIQSYESAALHCGHEALLLRYIWYDVDVNRDVTINEKEFFKILSRINFSASNPRRSYRQFCRQLSIKPSVGLRLDQLLDLFQFMKKDNIATQIWNGIFSPKQQSVDADEFLEDFLQEIQQDHTSTLADVKELFAKIKCIELDHGSTSIAPTSNQISRAQFEAFLFHEYNRAYDPNALVQVPELTRPLSYYYINTSHNTYLTGDQLQSVSSVEMYARSLRRGCRCLELDCWDGETTAGVCHPVVFHGHTLTSKILFADILLVVKNFMEDYPDTFPIILSLENHCSHRFQEAIAKLLTKTFGSSLYIPNSKRSGPLPSPEQLRGKVVIKGKRPPDPEEAPVKATTMLVDTFASESHGFSEVGNSEGFSHSQYDLSLYEDEEELVEDPKDDYDPYDKSVRPEAIPAGKPPVVVDALSRLTLFHGTKFKSFETSIQEPESHMHSISELKIFKVLGKSGANTFYWRKYNESHMTRTYPSGARVDSSNYNPILPWAVGCQMVALNFQTPDSYLILNDGLFRQNQSCGYVQKPKAALPGRPNARPKPPAFQLGIRVLGATCLPKPKGAKHGEFIDPYVQVAIHDMNGYMYTQGSFSTPSVSDNGFCPVWKNQKMSHFVVFEPTLAMIQFSLREADIALDDDVAFAAIPLQHLRTGYRSIQLYDQNNTRTGPFRAASLLVQIVKDTTITLEHADPVDTSAGSMYA